MAARSYGPLGLCASPQTLCANPPLAGRIFLLKIAREHQTFAPFLEKASSMTTSSVLSYQATTSRSSENYGFMSTEAHS